MAWPACDRVETLSSTAGTLASYRPRVTFYAITEESSALCSPFRHQGNAEYAKLNAMRHRLGRKGGRPGTSASGRHFEKEGRAWSATGPTARMNSEIPEDPQRQCMRERLEDILVRTERARAWADAALPLRALLNRDGYVPIKTRLYVDDLDLLAGARVELLCFSELGLRLLDLHQPRDAGGITSDAAHPILRCRSCMWRWPCPTFRAMAEALDALPPRGPAGGHEEFPAAGPSGGGAGPGYGVMAGLPSPRGAGDREPDLEAAPIAFVDDGDGAFMRFDDAARDGEAQSRAPIGARGARGLAAKGHVEDPW
jgi:hypothetical protein